MRFPSAQWVRIAFASALCLPLLFALAACAQAAPTASQRSVTEAQNSFAFELYRRLATDPRENQFCSPYSVYTALAIVAEGARGQTARDMGRMLALPRTLQREDRAQPWNLAPLHDALAAQRRRLTRNDGSSPAERAEFDTLRAHFARADAHALDLRRRGDWDGAIAAQGEAAKLADQVNVMGRRMRLGELSLCSALWTDSRCAPPAALVRAVVPAYGAVLQQARFSSDPEAARRDINAWVASRTFNRIPELLGPSDVTALTTLVVTDAVAFRGDWQDEFNPQSTREQLFRLADGESAQVPLMWRGGPLRYGAFHADGGRFATPATFRRDQPRDESKFYPGPGGFQLVELPYKDSDLAMVVILPRLPGDLVQVESLLTPAALERWIAESAVRHTELELPRFRFERGGDVTRELAAMGLARACDPARAELDGLIQCGEAGPRQWVGSVIHRASIEVNEQGTVAVAATAIEVRASATISPAESPFVPVFRADRPFVFLIRDRTSGAILFLGRCARP